MARNRIVHAGADGLISGHLCAGAYSSRILPACIRPGRSALPAGFNLNIGIIALSALLAGMAAPVPAIAMAMLA